MTAAAEQVGRCDAMINVADPTLHAPPDMERAVLELVERNGFPVPDSRGVIVRLVLESLALEYSFRLDALGELLGRRPATVCMVGGGVANTLLCQLTADTCGVSVRAGVDQCTALGNGLAQALALGIVRDKTEIRQIVRDSFEMRLYEPSDDKTWDEKRHAYRDNALRER